MIKNTKYSILNADNQFVDFKGIDRIKKDKIYDIKLYNGFSIKCSKEHIFIVNEQNLNASDIIPDVTYLSTISGDSFVQSIQEVDNNTFLYDIVDADSGYTYITNGIYSHNCSFLGSGDNFIAQEHLKDIEENYIQTPIREEYMDKAMWIWEDPEELEDYLMAIDVATGHGDDYSVINIFKISEIVKDRVVKSHGRKKKMKVRSHLAVQVAEYYGRVTPQELAEIGYIYGKKYNNAYTVVDVTGGIGSQTVDKMFELGYETASIHFSEITHKPTRAKLDSYIKQSTKTLADGSQSKIDLVPGFFIGGNRGSVLTEMERAIRMKEIDIKSSRLLGELKTFVTVGGSRVADHKRSYHDDSIMSLSIGIYVMNFEMKKFSINPNKTKKILDAMIRLNGGVTLKTDENGKVSEENKYVIQERNPYGKHAWLFQGLDKRRG